LEQYCCAARGHRILYQVAETQSFPKPHGVSGLSKSAVSRSISWLEAELSARLFHRTTGSLTHTEAGRRYCERATQILTDLEDANRAVSQLQTAPRGRLGDASASTLHSAAIETTEFGLISFGSECFCAN
jgi:DNA-binding transcriptional LysR family regulator